MTVPDPTTAMTGSSRAGFLRERCRLCGAVAEIAPPERWMWRYSPDTGTFSMELFSDIVVLCIRCTLAHCSDEEKRNEARPINFVMERKQLIGLGDDATLFVHTSHPAYGSPDWLNDIRFIQYAAFYRGIVPPNSQVPGLGFREPDWPPPFDQPFGMLWFGWDTATEDLRTVARFTWRADDWSREGSLTLHGWSHVSAATSARLLRATEDFMHKTRGRPKGITDYTLADYERAFQQVAKRVRARPKLSEIASELRQDRGTITDNLKRWGFSGNRDFAAQTMQATDPK